jgi:hypothetical protein
MIEQASNTSILLIHDGELADVRDTFDDLGLGFVESPSARATSESMREAGIVIASPRFLLETLVAEDFGGVRIAITEGESKTLRGMLHRSGIEWLVRRPFHPAALRLLVLHCMYRGPEKRRASRVSIGAAVHYQVGWRKRGALLAEISEHDCRILAPRPVAIGRRLRVRLPSELAGGKALVLEGRVVRAGKAAEGDGAHEVCVLFDPLGSTENLRLKELVRAHNQGPAMLAGPLARHLARRRSSDPDSAPRQPRSAISFGGPVATEGAADASAVPSSANEERRGDARHTFDRRVIALGEQATRVLVGRDISHGGMRVDPSPMLHLGQELQIAIHVPGNDSPLVLEVRVERVDREEGGSEGGMLLRFLDPSPTAAEYLAGVLEGLPQIQTTSSADGPGAVHLISEIVDSAA